MNDQHENNRTNPNQWHRQSSNGGAITYTPWPSGHIGSLTKSRQPAQKRDQILQIY